MGNDIKGLREVKKDVFTWTGSIMLFSCILCVICLIVCIRAIKGSNVDFLRSSEVHTMPDLIGLTQSQCENLDTVKNLNIEFIKTPSNKEKAGIVFSQSIDAGEKVTNNQTISVKVSSGEEFVQVPNSIGQDLNTAKLSLNRLGLYYEIVYISSDDNELIYDEDSAMESKIKAHTVVKIEPKEYSSVKEGETVKLYVERPYIDTVRTVPNNLYGKTWSEAVSLMDKANISNYLIYYIASDGEYNRVVSVWPTGDISIEDTVYIKVSGGPNYSLG